MTRGVIISREIMTSKSLYSGVLIYRYTGKQASSALVQNHYSDPSGAIFVKKSYSFDRVLPLS